MPEFKSFGKIARLNRDMVITEKIDGTNAGVIIEPWAITEIPDGSTYVAAPYGYLVTAQSRNRLIKPDDDNFGFAKWVHENAIDLVYLLGEGVHFGEWYGKGIQRGYGLPDRRFALFNTSRYEAISLATARVHGLQIDTVPELYRGPFDQEEIAGQVDDLHIYGSMIPGAVGFKAEGVIVYHEAARQFFKVTCEGDEKPKSVAA